MIFDKLEELTIKSEEELKQMIKSYIIYEDGDHIMLDIDSGWSIPIDDEYLPLSKYMWLKREVVIEDTLNQKKE